MRSQSSTKGPRTKFREGSGETSGDLHSPRSSEGNSTSLKTSSSFTGGPLFSRSPVPSLLQLDLKRVKVFQKKTTKKKGVPLNEGGKSV